MDPTQRFLGRVENYARYRPGYPAEVLQLLRDECGLIVDSTVADIGSGTGILARMFLENGNRVFGVEPNGEMRAAGERLLADYGRFTSVAGKAEETTLPDESVDFVTAGQAFHWFDAEGAREEFARILKPEGWVVLIWNTRRTDATPFMADYERLLRDHGTDYETVTHGNLGDEEIGEFFDGGAFAKRTFGSRQAFDLEGLRGRLSSSSFVPGKGQPGFEEMIAALDEIFLAHEEDGAVEFEYDTRVYYGRLLRG